MRLLVTRPEHDAARTAASLRCLGHRVLEAPLLRIEPVSDVALGPGPWQGIVMTSANAARALRGHPRLVELLPMPVLAIGAHTAEAARAAGFGRVKSAGGDREVLAAGLGTGRWLYLAGENRAAELPGQVQIAVVYRAVASQEWPANAHRALAQGEIDGVLHFSRRSAALYRQHVERSGLTGIVPAPVHFCLSRQVAGVLTGLAGAIRVAPRPEEAALIAMVT